MIQVKRFRSKKSTLSRVQWSEIIYQLKQCKDVPVVTPDGAKIRAHSVIFLTPYTIDTRLLEEKFDAELHDVKVVDGDRLITLINREWPGLYDEVLGVESRYREPDSIELFNHELARALEIDPVRDYTEYYSDLNFFVGTVESREVISSKLEFTLDRIHVQLEDWPSLEQAFIRVKHLIDVDITTMSVAAIRVEFERMQDLYECAENKRRRANCDILRGRKSDSSIAAQIILRSINEQLLLKERQKGEYSQSERRLADSVRSVRILRLDGEPLPDKIDLWNAVENMREACANMHSSASLKAVGKSYLEKINELRETLEQLVRNDADLREERSRLHEYPSFTVQSDVESAARRVNERIDWFRRQADCLNRGDLGGAALREFLEQFKALLAAIDVLRSNKITKELIALRSTDGAHENRFKVSAHSVFDAGVNVAVYGEAGAGKSTTLHVYAHTIGVRLRSDEAVIFVPLNRMLAAVDEKGFDINSEVASAGEVETLLRCFLIYRSVEPSQSTMEDLIRFLGTRKRSIFLFDGLDEAARRAYWLTSAISLLPEKFPAAQVILRLTLIKPHDLRGRIVAIRVSEESDDFSWRAL